jgi:hypothetical protein
MNAEAIAASAALFLHRGQHRDERLSLRRAELRPATLSHHADFGRRFDFDFTGGDDASTIARMPVWIAAGLR